MTALPAPALLPDEESSRAKRGRKNAIRSKSVISET